MAKATITGFSLTSALARFCLAVLVMWLAVFLRDSGALWFVLPAALTSLKYLLYDGFVWLLRRLWRGFMTTPWFWVGYAAALALDVVCCWNAASGEVDAGFAYLATFILSPVILGGGLLAMVLHTIAAGKKRRTP